MRPFVPISVLLSFAAPLGAQSGTAAAEAALVRAEHAADRVPFGARVGVSVFADLDGDGDLDAVTSDQLVLQREPGRFVLAAAPDWGGRTVVPLAGIDLDVDGDDDLVVRDVATGRARLFLTAVAPDGGVALTPAPVTAVPWTTSPLGHVHAFDADADGDRDLLVTTAAEVRIWRNDGEQRLVLTGPDLPGTGGVHIRAIANGDFDADGDQDLVLSWNWESRVFLNDGRGSFGAGPSGPLPWAGVFTVLDIDGDTDLDVYVSQLWDGDTVLVNDGTGRFDADAERAPGANSWAAVALDVDGDGRDELALGSTRDAGVHLLRPRNGGHGGWEVDTTSIHGWRPAVRTLRAVDLDGNGALDLVASTDRFTPAEQDPIYFGDGVGGLWNAVHPRVSFRGGADAVLADVTGDGALDLLIANSDWGGNGEPDVVLAGDGFGNFVEHVRLPQPGGVSSLTVEPVDLDGDGDLDLVAGTIAGHPSRVFDNDNGRFVHRDTPGLNGLLDDVTAIEAGDFTGDGLPDVVLGGFARGGVFVQDGAGGFVDITTTLPGHRSILWFRPAQIADVDGDGLADLIVSEGTRLRVLKSLGGGAFATFDPIDSRRLLDFAVGDVDADGDVDIVARTLRTMFEVVVLFNDGTGRFRVDPATPALVSIYGGPFDLVDVDGDGDLDLANAPELLVNDGKGSFTAHRGGIDSRVVGREQSWGDVDGDSDLDVVSASGILGTNVTRQLFGPRHAFVGTTIRFGVDGAEPARPGALVALSSARRASPVRSGLGSFALSGALAVGVARPAADGDGEELLLAIPNDASLRGVDVYAQALRVEGAGPRWTNLVELTIR